MSHTNGVTGSSLLQTLLTQTDAVNTAKTSRTAAANTVATAKAQDSTQLSTTASALLQSSAVDDVRHEKVQSIRDSINNGTYSVSPHQVAEKLIQSLQS